MTTPTNIIDAACRIDYEYKELQKDCNDLKKQLAEAKTEVAALTLLLKQAQAYIDMIIEGE